MNKNKTTYVLEIDAEISELKKQVEQSKKALASLGETPFAKGLDKKIGSILVQIDRLQKKAAQPISSKGAFSSLEKGFGDIVVDAKNLLKELQNVHQLTDKEKISLLPPEESKRIREAITAVQAYEKAVERLERKRVRDLEGAKISKKETTSKLSVAREEQKSVRQTLKKATDKSSEYGQAQILIQQAEAAKKAKKEIKDLDKQIESYREELEKIKKIENQTGEQKNRAEILRKNISSLAGQKGAKTKIINAAPDEANLTAARNVVATQTPQIEELEKAARSADAEVIKLSRTLEKLNEKIDNNSDVVSQSQTDYKVMYEQAKKLGISLEDVTEDVNPQNIQLLTNRLKELIDQGLQPLEAAADEASTSLEEVGKTAATTGEKISYSAESYGALADNDNRINNLKQTVAQFVGWTGASKALSAALRNAFQDIKELDAAMTEIAVVTDFDVGDMWDQLPEYTERANELGMSITEVYNASALFYQQGLETNEMVELSNETLKMARIAGLDASEATDRMTAALRGFNMELNQASAQKVADVYSQLAAITAADVDEISSAMTKTASIASSAGMEFETTAAFLSQIIETTRESAETAGTAMKTVIARFQELKKAPDEIGEVDGEIVDANAIETALRSVGVSLRDASGQFRELDEVFLELSSKWDSLDKNTQRYIATIAAGSRQQSRFIAMMSDYERTQELVTAANNSAGASQKQYEKTLESLETKLKRLENAWTEFSTGLMNSDFVKFAVDLLTNILNMLNQATKGFNSFTSSLTKIGTLVAIFQLAKTVVNKFFNEIITNIYQSAYQAGENIAKGVSDGINKSASRGENRLFGYTQISNGVKDYKNAKSIRASEEGIRKGSNEEATKWQIKHNALLKQKNELEKDGIKNQEEYDECLKNIEDSEKSRIYSAEELANMEKKAFQEITAGASAAAQAITLVGVGINVIGQMFTNAGFEETGEVISAIGTGLTIVGSVLMTLVPIISLLGTTITVAGEKISIAGYMAQTAWWPLLVIMLAIAAVVAVVVIAANAIKKASPEYKLEKAQEAADKATDAADRTAEAYENLKDSFEGLENGYKALEDLTKGTEEWNDAVRKINNSVLDLIAKYPELAKFVDNEGGVLTLDINDANVQAVLNQAKNDAIMANSGATMANVNLAKAEDDLAYKYLDDDAKFNLGGANAAYGGAMAGSIAAGAGAGAGIGALVGTIVPGIGNAIGAAVGAGIGAIGGLIGGFFTGDAAKDAALEDTQSQTEALAKAIADGAIIDNGSGYEVMDEAKLKEYGVDQARLDEYYAEVGDSTEALRDFGNQLLETQRQEEAAFAALAASAYSLADTLGFTKEEQDQASNIVDEVTADKIYKEKLAALGDTDFTSDDDDSGEMSEEDKQIRDQAIKKQYGPDARIEGDTVTFRDAEKKQQTETLTSDEIKAIIANQQALQEASGLVEIAPQVVNEVVDRTGLTSIEKATMDQEGGNLTKAEAEELASASSTEKLKQAWEGLGETEQAVFGSYEDYLEKTQGAAKIAMGDFDKLEAKAQEMGLVLDETFTTDLAKGFIQKMEDAFEISGTEGVQKIQKEYDTLLGGVDNEEKKAEITALMNGIDWTDAEALLSLRIQLKEVYGLEANAVDNMVDAMIEGADATSSLSGTIEVFGKFYQATEQVNRALQKTADLQWDYERLLNQGANATELGKNRKAQEESIYNTGMKAMEAYEAALGDQIKREVKGLDIKSTIATSASDYIDKDEFGNYDFSRLQEQIDAGHFGEEDSDTYKALMAYVDDLKEGRKIAQEQLDIARDSYEQLEEMAQEEEESYWDLWEMLSDAIITNMEKTVDIQKDILEATEETNERLLEKMQSQIDAVREKEQNEKTKENLAEMYSKIAYLSQETSGINLLELLDLDKQISEEEKAFQDTLVDQALQKLQDANDKAQEQRDRQIFIAEQQLEAYKLSDEHQAEVTSGLNSFLEAYNQAQIRGVHFDPEDTYMGTQLETALSSDWLNDKEGDTFWSNVNSQTDSAAKYLKALAGGEEEGEEKTGIPKANELLEDIKNNTAMQIENAIKGNLATADKKDSDFKATTGYDIKGTGNEEVYYDSSGNFDSTAASSYSSKVHSIATTANAGKLTTGNGVGESRYESIKNYTSGASSSLLTKEEYYEKINNGENVTVNGKTFNQDSMESWLKDEEGSYDSSYGGYVSAYYQQEKDVIDKNDNQHKANDDMDKIVQGKKAYNNDALEKIVGYMDAGEMFPAEIESDEERKRAYAKYLLGGKFKENVGWALKDSYVSYEANGWESSDPFTGQSEINGVRDEYIRLSGGTASGDLKQQLDNMWALSGYTDKYPDATIGTGIMALINDDTRRHSHLWARKNGVWRHLKNSYKRFRDESINEGTPQGQLRQAISNVEANYPYFTYQTGGLADFTGPAWLDGTKSKPEIVLNQRDSANFIVLRDILGEVLNGTSTINNNSNTQQKYGDNHFDIEINVEKLENDYDVEQIANKIRSMIYEDATYRNVNAIGMIR